MLDSSSRTLLGMFQAVLCITASLRASPATAGRTSTTSSSLLINQVGDIYLSYWVQCHCNLRDSHRLAWTCCLLLAELILLNSLPFILNRQIVVFPLSHYTIVWRKYSDCINKSNLRFSGNIHFGGPLSLKCLSVCRQPWRENYSINFHQIQNILIN